jgi:hypothetical protein
MSRLTNVEWVSAMAAAAADLPAAEAIAEDVPALRATLVRFDVLMRRARAALLDTYQNLGEEALALPLDGDPPERPGDEAATSWMFWAARQIRWLDQALHRAWRRAGAEESSAEAWRSAPPGGPDVYVVPRRRPRRRPAKGQPYGHRGLLLHAILPAFHEGDAVELRRDEMVADAEPGTEDAPAVGFAFGAVLAPAFGAGVLLTEEHEEGFRVTALAEPDPPWPPVEDHLAAAVAQGCHAVVWPELLVSPDRRARIAAWLRRRPWTPGQLPAPRLVVAGSWHEEEAGAVYNIATVLGPQGQELLRYRKRLPFIRWDDKAERIALGDRVAVLVTESAIVGLAICRDHCDRRDSGVALSYPTLDLDLVLVPSLGNASAAAGHLMTACDLYDRCGGRSFVVQQSLEPPGRPPPPSLGEVIGPGDGSRPDRNRQELSWRVYQLPP